MKRLFAATGILVAAGIVCLIVSASIGGYDNTCRAINGANGCAGLDISTGVFTILWILCLLAALGFGITGLVKWANSDKTQ
jgi:hypothetical protein